MVSKTVTIEAPNGMHARPVSALVALVKASGQQVTLRTPAKSVSGASMIGILSLGLKKGSEVEVASKATTSRLYSTRWSPRSRR